MRFTWKAKENGQSCSLCGLKYMPLFISAFSRHSVFAIGRKKKGTMNFLLSTDKILVLLQKGHGSFYAYKPDLLFHRMARQALSDVPMICRMLLCLNGFIVHLLFEMKKQKVDASAMPVLLIHDT
jgi:hypothetical protein